ncbi:PTS sugar transporter subunit IIA [Lacticaseibacillus baoqingensis]|uniref:PTS sugar transporter subunit IIA n=1 Tax=Lacticaseibacillus baoqingensis TaxID=2486013 RepID=A0ABW4E3L2_9LACO|nr:PTS sugar transporter subunit IIA [Lacticaseibacillus baoqingensis]
MVESTVESLFDPEIIDLDIDVNTKDEAIKYLAKRLEKAGYVNNLDAYVKDIYFRESEGITGMGDNVAIPHGKSSAVVRTGLAIGHTRHMIPWESYDGKPVNVIFLFAVADNNAGSQVHLRLLADVAGRLGNDEVLEAVKTAKTPEELHQALFQQ